MAELIRNVNASRNSGEIPHRMVSSPTLLVQFLKSCAMKYPKRLGQNISDLLISIGLFVEYGFDQFLVQVDSVEQGLDVDLAFLAGRIEQNLDIAAGYEFAVEGTFYFLCAVIEVEFGSDFFQSSIQKDVLPVKDNDRIDDVLKVADLMCGDEQGRVLASVFGYCLAELSL